MILYNSIETAILDYSRIFKGKLQPSRWSVDPRGLVTPSATVSSSPAQAQLLAVHKNRPLLDYRVVKAGRQNPLTIGQNDKTDPPLFLQFAVSRDEGQEGIQAVCGANPSETGR